MSDVLIPKEQLTPYQRWELPSFNPQARAVVECTLPTAAEIEEIQRQAQEEGRQLGHEEGYREGYQSGYAEGLRKANEETQRLRALADSLTQQVDQQVTQQLLDLALDIAQQVIRQALQVKPELLLAVVKEAVASLPAFSAGAHVSLHPDDAELVRQHLGEQLAHTGWKLLEDARIARGGAHIETANSRIDASLETRWKRVVATLGQDRSWVAE